MFFHSNICIHIHTCSSLNRTQWYTYSIYIRSKGHSFLCLFEERRKRVNVYINEAGQPARHLWMSHREKKNQFSVFSTSTFFSLPFFFDLFADSLFLLYCFASLSHNGDKKKQDRERTNKNVNVYRIDTFSLYVNFITPFSFDNSCYFYFEIFSFYKTNINDESSTTPNCNANSFWLYTTSHCTWTTTNSNIDINIT